MFQTKYFINRLIFFVHACVCDQFPEQYKSTILANRKLPKSRVGAVPRVFGHGRTAVQQPTKTIKKIHFIARKIVKY
jgi:hypothetical protein